MSIAQRLAQLESIGVRADGVYRLAWSEEDAQCRAWFERQAAQTGLAVTRDPAGNLWAYPDRPPPWWAVGSHLDSVLGGGRFDGPLGVACGFEVAQLSGAPIAVISFADEEGARWGTPTFGSKALAGRLDSSGVLDREDEQGVRLTDAIRAAGIDPHRIGEAPSWLTRLSGFIEVHIDQSTDVARAGVPIAVVSALANRMRLVLDVRGRADHAGTTPRPQRSDALVEAARLIVAADELAADFLTVTSARIVVEPNAQTTIASRVRVWIDARCEDDAEIDAWLARFEGAVDHVRERVTANVSVASRSAGRAFSTDLRSLLARVAQEQLGRPVPEVVCFAGHDAGIVAERIPAAMVLVRNRSGISHSPLESVELEDAEVAVQVLAMTLEQLQ